MNTERAYVSPNFMDEHLVADMRSYMPAHFIQHHVVCKAGVEEGASFGQDDDYVFSVLLLYDLRQPPVRICVRPTDYIVDFKARASWYLKNSLPATLYAHFVDDKGKRKTKRLRPLCTFAEENITDTVALEFAFCV
jgi:hypothetical protein